MKQRTCAELVALVKDKGPAALDGVPGLDEFLDIDKAAEFTGLSQNAVRHYHGVARRQRAEFAAMAPKERKATAPKWAWPEPDLLVARHPAWTKRTLILARAAMPGRGKGGAPTRRRYTEDERSEAVRTYRDSGRSLASVADELGVNLHTLAVWVSASTKS